jgi:hypothetical protein
MPDELDPHLVSDDDLVIVAAKIEQCGKCGREGVERLGCNCLITELPPTVQLAGDPRRGDATWTLMPAASGVCSQCAVDHDPDILHDKNSLFYQYAFYAEHNRWPTWADAMAHCTPEVQKAATEVLHENGIEI